MAKELEKDDKGTARAGGLGDADARLGENHPLAKLAGSYKDDPFWDEFVQAMKDAREVEDRHLAEEQADVRS